jgi:hypothetical protein
MVKRTVYFSRVQWKLLEDVAADHHISVSQLIRKVLGEYLGTWMERHGEGA